MNTISTKPDTEIAHQPGKGGVSFFAPSALLPHESEAEYHQMRESLAVDMDAEGTAEQLLIEQMVGATLAIRRCDAMLITCHHVQSGGEGDGDWMTRDQKPFPLVMDSTLVPEHYIPGQIRDEWDAAGSKAPLQPGDIWRLRAECPDIWYFTLINIAPYNSMDTGDFMMDNPPSVTFRFILGGLFLPILTETPPIHSIL